MSDQHDAKAEIVRQAVDGVHWNDFDAEHPGQREEILAVAARAVDLALEEAAKVVDEFRGDGDWRFCIQDHLVAAIRALKGEG